MEEPELPVVCSLTTEALQARRLGLLSALLQLAQEREPISDGMRLWFQAGPTTLPVIAQAV